MALPAPLAVGKKITAAFLNALLDALTDRPAAASGTVSFPLPTALNTAVTASATFPAGRFDVAPVVVLQLLGPTRSTTQNIFVTGTSTTGASFSLMQNSGSLIAATANWIAVEQT